ncbi:MAG: hypothetical protein ACJAVI_005726 [Candidatus Azotimanducaceae bacterium]|jgi:hypothetical protein
MIMWILPLLNFILPLLSCMCLAVSQKKYAKEVFGRGAQFPEPLICRQWAWAFLVLSLLVVLQSDQLDFVIILWPMLFGVDALIVALVIAFRPRWLRILRVLPGLSIS